MNVSLGDKWEAFVQERVQSGRYLSASEVIREALRSLEEQDHLRQRRLEELRGEIQVGLDELARGEFVEVEPGGLDQFFEEVKSEARNLPKIRKAAS